MSEIAQLVPRMDAVIRWSLENHSPLGYFAAVYKRVTLRIDHEVAAGRFDDNQRMVTLDMVFAERYLGAFEAFQRGEKCSLSWLATFDSKEHDQLCALQHILVGMNAHIIFDLGIAAAEVAPGEAIFEIKNDFFSVNEILISMIDEIQDELSRIWWPLKVMDIIMGRMDERFAAAVIRMARSKAWDHALIVALADPKYRARIIQELDKDSVEFAARVTRPPGFVKFACWLMRKMEGRNVSKKIQHLDIHNGKELLPSQTSV